MPPDARGLALIVQAESFEKVHYALSIAAAAGAVGRPAVLFFTMRALWALQADEGWRRLPGAEADARYRELGIAGFEELLDACRELGVRLMACESGLRAVGMERTALRDDLAIEEGGLATLLLDAAEADLIHV